MPVYLDRTITGDGEDVFSGSTLLYVAASVIALGQQAQIPDPTNTDLLQRFGWIAIGDQFDIGDGTREFWRDVLWINWMNWLWTPDPTGNPAGADTFIGTRVRWHIGVGGSAHLHVFGT